jgi:hypothetical protein
MMNMNKKAVAAVALIIGLIAGNVTGFMAGVSSTKVVQDFFQDIALEETAADVGNPKTIQRAGFSVKTPGNWTVDTKMEDHDADNYFSIDSPGDSYALFTIYELASEPKENVEEQITSYDDYVKTSIRTHFSKWGRYSGYGIDLKGRIAGFTKGGVRVFSHSTAERSFTVTEWYYDEDKANTQPGFKLIESTFDFKKTVAPTPKKK